MSIEAGTDPVVVEVIVPTPEAPTDSPEDNAEVDESPVYEPGNALDFEHRITVLEGQMALLVPIVSTAVETAESAVDIADEASAEATNAVDIVIESASDTATDQDDIAEEAAAIAETNSADESADAVVIETEPDALPARHNLSDRYYGKVRLPWQH